MPEDRAILLRNVRAERLDTLEGRARAQAFFQEHHYLGGLQGVGEQIHYAVSDGQGEWVAVGIFAAAAKHLRPREQWNMRCT